MKIIFYLSLMLIFGVSTSFAKDFVLRTGKSGKNLKVLSLKKLVFKKGPPALMLRYQTDIAPGQVDPLRQEAKEIWEDFYADAQNSNLTAAVISAVYGPSEGVTGKNQAYNFVFQKDPSGIWNAMDPTLNQWCQIIQQKDVSYKVKALSQLAQNGDVVAQFTLGNIYLFGLQKITRTPPEAFKWYQMASQQGYPPGDDSLAKLYFDGVGVKKDEAQAVTLFTRAAEKGYAPAEANLGALFLKGVGVPKDEALAFEWIKKAAEQGFPDAEAALGTLYQNGEGVEKDIKKALKLIKKAAEEGSAQGQASLSNLYTQGLGVSKNCKEAFKWAQLSVQGGSPEGEDYLGSCYENGCGTTKDLIMALKWYQLSAERGCQGGVDDFKRLQPSTPTSTGSPSSAKSK